MEGTRPTPTQTERGNTPSDGAATLSGPVRFARLVFFLAAAAFAICVTVQVFLAGMAVFVNPSHWASHVTFVRVFEFVPLLMLLLGFVGRVPPKLRWQSAALFGLIFAQYLTANIRAVVPLAAALHPVVALILFWVSTAILPDSWRLAFHPKSHTH